MVSFTQHLYYATEVGGSGFITTLRLQRTSANAASVTCPNFTVKMGNTSLAALGTTFASNVNTGQGSQVTVLNNATVTVPAGAANAWFDIPLTTPYYYNGEANLVVQFERPSVCSANMATNTVSAATNRRAGSSATPPATYNTTTALFNDTTENLMQFVFAGGDETVTAADRAGNNGNYFAPASTGRAQFLILASDIKGSGPLTGIQFNMASGVGAGFTGTTTITLSTVPAATTQLTNATFATNVGSNPTVVANNVTVTLPAGTTSFWVPLTGSFNYDGTSNLLVDVQSNIAAGATVLAYQNAAANRILAAPTTAAATGTFWMRGLEPVLRFNGGPMEVKPIGGVPFSSGDAFPFWTTSGMRQYLLTGGELGTSGTITKLSCYTTAISTTATSAAATETYKIVMSNIGSASTVLSTTRAANLPSPVTVFNGTLNIPAGIVVGDYLDIPLATPFTYNGTGNLVVDISGTGTGGVGLACGASNNAINNGQMGWDAGGGPNVTTISLFNTKPALRFTLVK